MTLDQNWFTEICEECGSAFSLKMHQQLESVKTDFQTIDIYDTVKFGKLMVIDGFIMLSSRENFLYHEMMSHPAMFTHINPQKVVIIGGGDCGTLHEILRHDSVHEAWQIEIDEQVTRLSEKYFPELCESNHDPRANLYFGDGIQWMKDAEPDSIDIIIIDSTDPIGPAEGLFGKPFYQDCIKALKADGILVQQSESPLFHMDIIKPMHIAMREVGLNNVQTLHFPQAVYPSGWWTCTIASQEADLNHARVDAINTRPFKTQYYNADIHHAAKATPQFMKEMLES